MFTRHPSVRYKNYFFFNRNRGRSIGHTVTSQRIVVESILKELNDYGRSLNQEDKPAFRSLLSKIKIHLSSIGYACSYNTWALVLFSILLEQEKQIHKLK